MDKTRLISEPNTRRGFLGLIGKTGLVVVGAGTALVGTEQMAWAGNAACCQLRYPPGDAKYCRVNGSGSYICPSPGALVHLVLLFGQRRLLAHLFVRRM